MARRHRKQFIPPFPEEIDRNIFGPWLSGFVAGEGCFYLGLVKRNGRPKMPYASFVLGLRYDDLSVLQLIQSYWQCGVIHHRQPSPNDSPNALPSCTFSTKTILDLIEILIPHFEKYPLFAKKNADFGIWSQAVKYCHYVMPSKNHCYRGKPRRQIIWTIEKVEKFSKYVELLRSNRKPNDQAIVRVSKPLIGDSQKSLFDLS